MTFGSEHVSTVEVKYFTSCVAAFLFLFPKLVLITPGGTPDVYDQPQVALDVSINKSFGDRLVVKVQGRNLMDSDFRRSYSFKEEEYNFQSFNLGRTFSLRLSYNFTKEL